MQYLELINNYRVWLGQTVKKPARLGGGTGTLTMVRECEAEGPERGSVLPAVRIDEAWCFFSEFIQANNLALPKEITGYTSQGADGEDWIS